MAITWSQIEKLNLTWDEMEQLGLSWDELDSMSYDQLSELVRIRLEREIPSDNEALMEYTRSNSATINVLSVAFNDLRQQLSENEARNEARQKEKDALDAKERKKDRIFDFLYFIGGYSGLYYWMDSSALLHLDERRVEGSL